MADEPTPELPAHRTPTDRDTNSPFWTETLPPLEEHTKRLFIEYAKIPEDKIHEHLEEAVSCSPPDLSNSHSHFIPWSFPNPTFNVALTHELSLSLFLSARRHGTTVPTHA